MVEYCCEKCGKEFKQKCHYDKHKDRKLPCVKEEKLKEIIGKIVDEKLGNNIKEEKKKLKPIIKWSGGKKDELKNILPHIPENYTCYLEPFVGGGALFFHLNPEKGVINDIHKELIDFYQSIKNKNSIEIYNFMKEHPNNEETYYNVRSLQVNNPLDNAKKFYYLRKTCFRGMLRYNSKGEFNIPFGRYKNYNYEEIKDKNYEELLCRTEIYNKNFEYIFENYNSENNFMFLDPPYDSEFTDYGYCKFGKKEQEKLAECFKKPKIK